MVYTGTSISVACLLWPTGSNFTFVFDGKGYDYFGDTAVSNNSAATIKTVISISRLDGNSQHTLVLQKVVDDPGWVSSIIGDQESHLMIDSFT